jgi:hypothetical protein
MSIVQSFQTRQSAQTTSRGRTGRTLRFDSSLAGILIFGGLGFGLSILAAIFHWLELPPPAF